MNFILIIRRYLWRFQHFTNILFILHTPHEFLTFLYQAPGPGPQQQFYPWAGVPHALAVPMQMGVKPASYVA